MVGSQRAIRADLKDAARERADSRDRVSRIKGVIETLQSVLLAEPRRGSDGRSMTAGLAITDHLPNGAPPASRGG